ncbi:MAG: peptidylprolyl isomerase [Planctomycetaceae bacterium]
MGERIHSAVPAGRATRKTWTLVVAGTAVLLLAAGVLLQVTRPTSAYPEDGAGPSRTEAGRATTAAPAQQTTRKMAKVGKEYVSYDDLAAECVARHGSEILDNLINRKIIQQACNAQGVEVSEAEVNEEILKISKKFGLDKDEWMKMLQAERNVTPEQYRRDIIWPMLALKKLAGEEITISKEDLKKAFIRNYGPRVKARAIVLDNQRRAAEVWQKANDNPDDFGRLAREHSVDPTSRPLEGMIPPIRRYAGSDELEKAAFRLKEGEVSAVVQVGLNQFIILKCEGRTEPTVTDIAEVEDILRQELHEEKTQESVAKVFQKIKDDARIENYLTGVASGGERRPTAAKNGSKGSAVRPAGATGAPRTGARTLVEDEVDDSPAPPKRSAQAPAGRTPRTK